MIFHIMLCRHCVLISEAELPNYAYQQMYNDYIIFLGVGHHSRKSHRYPYDMYSFVYDISRILCVGSEIIPVPVFWDVQFIFCISQAVYE